MRIAFQTPLSPAARSLTATPFGHNKGAVAEAPQPNALRQYNQQPSGYTAGNMQDILTEAQFIREPKTLGGTHQRFYQHRGTRGHVRRPAITLPIKRSEPLTNGDLKDIGSILLHGYGITLNSLLTS